MIKILADMDSGVVFAVASGLAVGIAFIAVFSLNFPVIEGEELQSNTVQKLDLSFCEEPRNLDLELREFCDEWYPYL